MGGESQTEAVLGYLSRITGGTVSLDRPLQLRSVHRAAFTSWARTQNMPLRLAAITTDAPFTVRDLLQLDTSEITVTRPAMASATTDAPGFGIGIDIEEVDALPDTSDYREHPFFQDHFTPAEMAYCLQQRDAKASFCGTWSAKEAILKAGLFPIPPDRLNEIEVRHDALGRPVFPGCSLSISHTPRTAVAVCVVNRSPPPPQPQAVAALQAPVEQPPAPRPQRATMIAGWVVAAIIGSALTLAPHLWR